MKQLILSICIAFLLFQNAYCINNYKQGDELVVWAKSGLNLREEPNIQSKVISKIVLGETVVVQEGKKIQDLNIIDKQTLADGQSFTMTLRGSWVKVKFNDNEGFLFDAYLSKIKYEKDKSLHELLIDQKEICNEYKHDFRGRITILNDGTFIKNFYGESYGGYNIMIPFLPFEEAFIICIALISNPPKEIGQKTEEDIVDGRVNIYLWIEEDLESCEFGWSITKVGDFVRISYGGVC